MKYLFIELETRDGEFEYIDIFLSSCDDEIDKYDKANKIASTFLGNGKLSDCETYYEFNSEGDYRLVEVHSVSEVPESEYKILKKYLVEL